MRWVEGVYGTDKGVYVANSYAFNTAELSADAVKHDGMVLFVNVQAPGITLAITGPWKKYLG